MNNSMTIMNPPVLKCPNDCDHKLFMRDYTFTAAGWKCANCGARAEGTCFEFTSAGMTPSYLWNTVNERA